MVMLPITFVAIISIVVSESMMVLYIALILYGISGKIGMTPILIAVVSNSAPRVGLSTSFSVYNFVGMSASIIAPVLTGFITDVTGSFNMAFYVAAGLTLVGLICSALLDVSENKTRLKNYKKMKLHIEEIN